MNGASTESVFGAYDAAMADIRASVAGIGLDETFSNGGAPCSVRWV